MESLFHLPAELRARIWHLCLPAPRHVVFQKRKGVQTPAILHICRESRSEAQRHYVQVPLSPARRTSDETEPSAPYAWIDFSRDTIALEPDSALLHLDRPSDDLAQTQRLAFEFCAPQNFMQLLEILTPVHRCLDRLPALREVVLYSLPKKWFEDHTGRVQFRQLPLTSSTEAARILLRLLHMLFGGHAWLDSDLGIPPPLRWEIVCNDEADVWAGPFAEEERYEYVFRCAGTGRFEIQRLTWEELGRLRRVEGKEARVHGLVGCYEGCPEHIVEDSVVLES